MLLTPRLSISHTATPVVPYAPYPTLKFTPPSSFKGTLRRKPTSDLPLPYSEPLQTPFSKDTHPSVYASGTLPLHTPYESVPSPDLTPLVSLLTPAPSPSALCHPPCPSLSRPTPVPGGGRGAAAVRGRRTGCDVRRSTEAPRRQGFGGTSGRHRRTEEVSFTTESPSQRLKSPFTHHSSRVFGGSGRDNRRWS